MKNPPSGPETLRITTAKEAWHRAALARCYANPHFAKDCNDVKSKVVLIMNVLV